MIPCLPFCLTAASGRVGGVATGGGGGTAAAAAAGAGASRGTEEGREDAGGGPGAVLRLPKLAPGAPPEAGLKLSSELCCLLPKLRGCLGTSSLDNIRSP